MRDGPNKVLLVVDESPYLWERRNVAHRMTRKIELLRDQGWDVVLVTLRARWELHELMIERGVPAYTTGIRGYGGLLTAAFRVSRIARAQKVDVIHGLGVFPALIAGASRFASARALRIYDRSHVRGRFRLDLASRVAARLCDATIAHSQAVVDAAVTLDRTDPAAIDLVYGGIDPPRSVASIEIEHLRRDLGIPEGAAIIGIVARLRPEKGHATLFEAAAMIAKRLDREVHVVVAGAGPYEGRLRALIGRTDPHVTHFVGHQDDIAPWYALADVVAIPSYQDALPRSVMEAMALGRPIVASRVGGLPEMIEDGRNGLLVDPRDPAALARVLHSLIVDHGRAAALGSEARSTYENRFTLQRRIQGWVDCYRSRLLTGAALPERAG